MGTRYNIIVPALIDPVFETFPASHDHFRFMLGYIPSLNEWLVSLFSFSIGVWIFLGALKYLSIDPTTGGESK